MFRCCTAVQIASASLLCLCGGRMASRIAGPLSNRVTELLELPLPIECTGRGFDADETRLQFTKDLEQLLATDPTDQTGRPLRSTPWSWKTFLPVDTENVNFHC